MFDFICLNFERDDFVLLLNKGACVLNWAKISWIEQTLPFNEDYQDCYYHPEGYLESCYISLLESTLFLRESFSPHAWVIGEIGFGFGLNFLAAASLWVKTQKRERPLVFISCEQSPVRLQDLKKAHSRFAQVHPFAQTFYESYHSLCPGVNMRFYPEENIVLVLYIGSANAFFDNTSLSVDHWMFDGFNPQSNPECWNSALLKQITKNTCPGGTFGTFTAQGQFRRELETLGWHVHKKKGFANKRHCLTGKFPASLAARASKTPRKAYVTGKGISGVSTAYFLSLFGVNVYDDRPIGYQASDVPYIEGVPGFHQHLCDYTLFNIQSWSFSSELYRYFSQSGLATLNFGLKKTVLRESFKKKIHNASSHEFFQDIFSLERLGTAFFPRGFSAKSADIIEALSSLTDKKGSFELSTHDSYEALKQEDALICLCDPYRASYWETSIEHPSLLRGQLDSFVQDNKISWQQPSTERYDFSPIARKAETGQTRESSSFVGFRTLTPHRLPLFGKQSEKVYANLYHSHRGYSSAPFCALALTLEALQIFSYQRSEHRCL